MVKINSTPFTPVISASGVDKNLESKLEKIGNEGQGLLNTALRNVQGAQNEASFRTAKLNEAALKQEIGINNVYENVQKAYDTSIDALKKIDAKNQEIMEKSLSDSFTLQHLESIKLNTKNFYGDLKSKADHTTDIFNETQNYLNTQIKEAVKNAPNDLAVKELYKDIAAFKIETLGAAIKDKNDVRQAYVKDSILKAQNLTNTSLRTNPSDTDYALAKENWIRTESMLSNAGFNAEDKAKLKATYLNEATDSYLNGLLDKGDTASVKEKLQDPELISLLTKDKSDSIIKRGLSLELENIDRATKEVNRTEALSKYKSGQPISNMPDADKVVFEENKQFIESQLANIGKIGTENAASTITSYFKERNGYFSPSTAQYMFDQMILGTDPNRAITIAAAIGTLTERPDTSSMLATLPDSARANLIETAAILNRHTKGEIDPVESVRIMREIKSTKLSDDESKIIKVLIENNTPTIDAMEDILDGQLWFNANLESDTSFVDRWFTGNIVNDVDYAKLDSAYKQAFSDAMYQTKGSVETSKEIAKNMTMTSNKMTQVNGRLQFFNHTPESLGLLSTKNGKDYFNETLDGVKKSLADAGYKNVSIKPIDGYTGYSKTMAYPFVLINDLTGTPIVEDGEYKMVKFDYTEVDAKDRNERRRFLVEKALLTENAKKAWKNAYTHAKDKNKGKLDDNR